VTDTKKKEKLAELGDDEVEGFLFNRLRYLRIYLCCVPESIILSKNNQEIFPFPLFSCRSSVDKIWYYNTKREEGKLSNFLDNTSI